jgi:hypothetical protein
MSKDESETLKIGGTKIPQWLVTIVASLVTSLIVGYFTLQASLQPIQLQISATQTAESRITSNPTAGVTFLPTAVNQQGSTPQQTVTPSMPQGVGILPSFFEKYYLLIAFWLLIAIANKHQRELLIEKSVILLEKPIIFKKDETSPITLYPRLFLEQTVVGVLNIYESPSIRAFATGLGDSTKLKTESTFMVLRYIFMLFVFLSCLYGVALATAISLNVMYPVYTIPEFLQHGEIMYFSGSLLSIIVGGETFNDNRAHDLLSKNPLWRKTVVFSSFLLLFFGFWVFGAMSIMRYSAIGVITLSSWMHQVALITFSIIIPFLNFLACLVTSVDAFTGLIIVTTSLALFIFHIIMIMVFRILSPLALFLLDVLVRSVILYMYIAAFVLITPIDILVVSAKILINKNTA